MTVNFSCLKIEILQRTLQPDFITFSGSLLYYLVIDCHCGLYECSGCLSYFSLYFEIS